MRPLLRLLYAAAANTASLAASLVPASNSKAAIAFRARRGIGQRYAAWAAQSRDASRPLLWMHAPSVGEGLMARPVLTALREKRPDLQLAYTFFSPSAEEFSRTLDVDFRDYLPFDASAAVSTALDALKPRALVFSKLDVWPELVRAAHARGVKLGLISASLPAESKRLSTLGSMLLRDAYATLDAVGAVDEDTAVRLVELGVNPNVVVVTGDTRYDQVWQRGRNANRETGLLARLGSVRPTFIAGSTWPPDEAVVLDGVVRARAKIPALRVMIAPHEVTREHLDPIRQWAERQRLTIAPVDDPAAVDADVILVDRYGVLGDLYALADVAFVGGGFHEAGLHSTLEPAAFGAPVLFGPKHHRSRDALALLKDGGARAVSSAADVEQALLDWLLDSDARRTSGSAAQAVIERGCGAADRSVALVESLL
ncbi:MAG TPA: glycosyltransferase N-terminal domain-containing protein [Gemmatimonadaceae bacterium]|nr:glycosyltransferase N-terminal domain-containing protein [Gemmatimonadaceae bacterium]